jgi:hypothetical protein
LVTDGGDLCQFRAVRLPTLSDAQHKTGTGALVRAAVRRLQLHPLALLA